MERHHSEGAVTDSNVVVFRRFGGRDRYDHVAARIVHAQQPGTIPAEIVHMDYPLTQRQLLEMETAS